MKRSTKTILALGCGIPVAFIIFSMIFTIAYLRFTKPEYRETAFQRDYTWNDIEVGTLIRYPINMFVPVGRYYVVVAIKTGQTNHRCLLLSGPKEEVPAVPKFVSGHEQTVSYALSDGTVTNIDFSACARQLNRDCGPAKP